MLLHTHGGSSLFPQPLSLRLTDHLKQGLGVWGQSVVPTH